MLKQILKILLLIFMLVIILFFSYLIIGHYNASSVAINYSDYTQKDNYIEFDNASTTGFIFYPGAKIESLSYSYLSDVEANVYIAQFPFEMAMFNYNIAQDIIQQHPNVDSWYIGGHSLGGVFAAEFASTHLNLFDGVVYLGSYPAQNNDLQIDELAIFGLDDLIVGDYTKHLDALGENAHIEVLENANHSGFGDYGTQKGDSELSENQYVLQHNKIVQLINQFMTNS